MRPSPKPDDALPCVWMTAGLVAYKLCDRGLDCEGCPFDAAMRGAMPAPAFDTAVLRGLPPPGAGLPSFAAAFPDDRRYHSGHLWVQHRATNRESTVRLGLDAFAARLLSHAHAVILPALGHRLEHGRVACWLTDGPDLVALASPVDGTVTSRNHGLRDSPALALAHPYDQGWLLEVRSDEALDENPALLDADDATALAERQLDQLYARLPAPAVGPTANDGGELVNDLRTALGRARFYQRIRTLFR